MQALSFLSQVSNRPVLFFRAVRSSITTAGYWVVLSDDWALQARYTHIFSAVHGFLGARKLVKIATSNRTQSLHTHVWDVVKRIKKFVAAVGWFCKAGRDKGHFSASFAAWTSYLKIVQVPFDCISLGFSVLKISRIAFQWIRLKHTTKNAQVNVQVLRLEAKATKELFYSASKLLDVSAFVFERMIPASFIFVSVNSLVATAVKIAALSYATLSK